MQSISKEETKNSEPNTELSSSEIAQNEGNKMKTEGEKRIIESEADKATNKRKIGNVVNADISEDLKKLCDKLKETNLHLMKLIYDEIGFKSMTEYVSEVEKIEKKDGLLTADKERKRTSGGIFFHLVRQKLGRDKFNFLVKLNQKERKRQKKETKKREISREENSET